MSLIARRVQKALQRSGGVDFAVVREDAQDKQPAELASPSELRERRHFLKQVCENTASAEVAYERIIHGNELQDVNYLARGTRAARAIGRVLIREPNGRLTGYGTGFLIGPGLLLTNNHVLSSARWAERSEIELEYERDESGQQLPGVKFPLRPQELFFTHEALDFSVVAVGERATNAERELAEFGFLPLIGGTGKAVEGEWLTIVQHPGGELKQVCVRENRLLRKAEDVLWYSTDTLGGASGAPVFNNDWLVVALHHSGVPDIKNGRWQTLDGHDYDENIHREEDIKWVANEGIRVSRIVQTLQQAVGAHPRVQAALNFSPAEVTPAPPRPDPPPHLPPMNAVIPAFPNFPASALAGQKFVLSFDSSGTPSLQPLREGMAAESMALALERQTKPKTKPKGVAFKFNYDYSTRKGFDVDFLGKGKHQVNLPKLNDSVAVNAVKLLQPAGTNDHVLHYTNMSLVMHAKRKFAIYTAANVDHGRRYKDLQSKRVWKYDPRISEDVQIGDEAYYKNQFDRGHLTRQEDLEYGDTMLDALQSTADTCHWTNCTLQHAKFNGLHHMWQNLEKHILEYAVDANTGKGFRAQIFTGPVFRKNDPKYEEIPDVRVPLKFWKVCVAVASTGRLFAVAYLADQSKIITKHGVAEAVDETPFQPFKLHQLPIAELEDMIQMTFTTGTKGKEVALSEFDPLKDGVPPELDADADGDDDRLESLGAGERAPEGRIDLFEHPPYFG